MLDAAATTLQGPNHSNAEAIIVRKYSHIYGK